MKFIDFFAGVGGIRLGLERSGHQCVGFCEFDKYARQSYKAMYNTEGEWESHDIRTVESYGIPRADLWCFGFPCQDLSMAGKRKGLQEGERSGLFYEIVRLLSGLRQEDKPRWLLAENVKGLFSSGGGFDFLRCIVELGQLGYNIEYQLLNTKDFGVPQNRERVFVVGYLGSGSGGKVFPIRPTDGENTSTSEEQRPVRLFNIYGRDRGTSFAGNVYDKNAISPTLNTMGGGNREPMILSEVKVVGNYSPSNHEASRVLDPSGIAPTVKENHGTVNAVAITPVKINKPYGTSFQDAGLYSVGEEIASCLSARYYKGLSEHHCNAVMVTPAKIDKPFDSPMSEIGLKDIGNETASCLLSREHKGIASGSNVVLVREATKQGYTEAFEGDSINLSQPNSQTRRGRVGKQIANTLTCSDTIGVVVKPEIQENVFDVYNNKMRTDGCVGTLTTKGHTSATRCGTFGVFVKPDIQKVDIPQMVKVRKYPVDTEKLVQVLREQKKMSGLSNKDIAEALGVLTTTVEHWFRVDQCFAIPEPKIWPKLKHLLNMDDITEFDESIMTFEEKEGVFDKAERCYLSDGIAPTITSAMAGVEKIIEPSLRIRKLTPKECWRLQGFPDEYFEKAKASGVSNSQLYKQAGNAVSVPVAEAIGRKLKELEEE